jgi:hypothetical protein
VMATVLLLPRSFTACVCTHLVFIPSKIGSVLHKHNIYMYVYSLRATRHGDWSVRFAEIIVMELLMILSLILVLSLISLNTVKYDYHVLLKLILFTYRCVAAPRYRDATLL